MGVIAWLLPRIQGCYLVIYIITDVNSATCTILGPPPTKKQRLSPDDYDYYEVGMTVLNKLI